MAACNTDTGTGNSPASPLTADSTAQHEEYDFSRPEKKFELPQKLREISGIAAISETRVACVQDELGKIYLFDLASGEVEKAIDFGKNGDYEGIAIKKEDAYILRSDGVIFLVKDFQSDAPKVKEFKTFLSAKNDAEGLCYDAKNDRLLIACKGKGGDGEEFKGKKAVYEFDLSKEKLKEEPAFLISMKEVKDSAKVSTVGQVAEFLGEEEGGFQPSEIAIHPITGEVYLSSSGGKWIVRLNKKGEVMKVHKLDPSAFKQPEGLNFLPNGDLLISNEGQQSSANMLRFKYLR